MSAIDSKAIVERFHAPHEVLERAEQTLVERGKAYGPFLPFVKTQGELARLLRAENLNDEQRFLITMILLKLQRWCNAPQEEQNADSLMDAINYLAALHVASYPKHSE